MMHYQKWKGEDWIEKFKMGKKPFHTDASIIYDVLKREKWEGTEDGFFTVAVLCACYS